MIVVTSRNLSSRRGCQNCSQRRIGFHTLIVSVLLCSELVRLEHRSFSTLHRVHVLFQNRVSINIHESRLAFSFLRLITQFLDPRLRNTVVRVSTLLFLLVTVNLALKVSKCYECGTCVRALVSEFSYHSSVGIQVVFL